MKINKAYKIRIYPNYEQTGQINKTIGCCRFVFNQMLAERKEAYEKLKHDKEALKVYRYKTEKELKEKFEFLMEVNSRALQQSRINLESAYRNFYAKRNGFPKFKARKRNSESYREPQVGNCIEIRENRLKLLKLGWIKLSYLPREFRGTIKSVTVSRTKTNEYYVSILTEQELKLKKRKTDRICGIDLGLKDFCVNSDGEIIKPLVEELMPLERKTRCWQKKLSRQMKESHRKEKTKLKLNQVYEKMKRLQDKFGWHLAKKLCSENQAISLERLCIRNMKKNRKLSHSIHLASWGSFISKLRQKSIEYGTNLNFADRFYASSKTCYRCKTKKGNLSLAERVFYCENCGYEQQRDINAALNLRSLIESSEYGDNKHREIIRPVRLRFDLAGSFVEVLTNDSVQNWTLSLDTITI